MIAMLLGVFAITPLTASAATINAVWWTDASDNTDFTASFDSTWISSGDWYKLMKYDEARGFYAQVSDSSGYVGTKTHLDFEETIRRSGNGKYKVNITLSSGTEYETAEKTYTFAGALDAPQNLRWDGEVARWGVVDGADNYDVCLYYKKEGDASFRPWSSASIQSSKISYDFTGQLSNPGTYYFTIDAISNDKTISISSSKSPEKTVSYTYSELNAHWGDVSRDQRKYMLYWNNIPDATGYYMVLSKKNGEAYQPVSGFDNKLNKLTGLDLYAVMEANGEGDYKVDFFAFNTSPTIPVSNEVSIEITFTNCEHSYTKKIQTSYYLHSESISCTSKTEYYYACEHCGEMAPKEAQYVYEGDIGEHDMSTGYQANGTLHWLACSKCDYAHYQNHTLDANNYCSTCDTTVYGVWLGDIQVTSKNCDDITGDGSAFYIPEQNRLFLTNYTDPDSRRKGISVDDPDDPDSEYDYVAMIYAKNGLNLRLRGENFLYEDAGDIGMQYGVVVENGDLKIEGSGSLYTNATMGFYTMDGDIYIDKNGGLLEIAAGDYAFRCADHNLYINNGKIKARSYASLVYISAPVLDNYRCYYAEIADNYDMNNPTAFAPAANVKYFYIEPAYTVTIEPFECEGDYITEVLRAGTEYELPACPYTAPDGKVFYKWGVTPPGNMYEVGEKFTITENLELTPIFKAITPTTLTATYSGTIFAGNKITPENIGITLTYSDSSTQPVNAGEVEYWYGGVQITDPVNYVFGADLIGDVNITVKYEGLEATMSVKVVGHEITFNANGGTGEMAKAEFVGAYTLPTCTFTAPDGKQFKGWATSADGDVITATTYNVTENVELFAIWEDIPSTPTTPITSISVSGADLPEVGETKDVMEFTPDSLTYGGEYKMVGRGFQKYTGTEWIDVSDTESLEYGVKYRVNLVLAPNEGYAFADSITSDDVTFNGESGIFETLISGVGYASIFYEFSYEAPATDYGITIAKKNGTETVGVLIIPENCTDVLGDGTVSYDPTTNTLTLNGYKYDGEGAEDDDIGYYGLMADLPVEGLTVVLVGENSIKISGSNSAGMVFFGNSDLTIKGDGSLTINTGMQGIVMAQNSSTIKIDGGNIDITTTAIAVSTKNFVMTGGNLKITTNMFGFATLSADGAFCINGGSVEISTANAGYAFIYADIEHETYNPIKPDLSGYVGACKMIAGNNADGSDATDFNEGYLNSYKYIKITEIESYGITIADKDKSGATVGVLITEENYTDVLGDGTVSYDPTTNTLTLNGYKYEGSGFGSDHFKYGIYVPDSIDKLIIMLEGENRIGVSTESDSVWTGAICVYETEVIVDGNGSLVINSEINGFIIDGEADSSLEIKGGNITVNAFRPINTQYFKISGGNLDLRAAEEGEGIYTYEFIMTGGNLKITSGGLGVAMEDDSGEGAIPMISGGTFEISTALEGMAFCYYDWDEDVYVAIVPELTNYVGAYKLTAGANADGTGATDYSASDIGTYKYIKLESLHVHDHGTAWESDANEHWNECSCGDKANKAAHTDSNNDGKCDTCEYQMTGGGSNTETPDNPDNPNNTPENPNNTPDVPNEDKDGLGAGAIVGIVIGSVAVVGIGGFALFWFVIKKKSFADLIAVFKKK